MAGMNDEQRETLIRMIWKGDELAEIYDEITEDEFVARVFKGYVDSMEIDKNSLYWSTLSVRHGLLQALLDYCKSQGLEMAIEGTKKYLYLLVIVEDAPERKETSDGGDAGQ